MLRQFLHRGHASLKRQSEQSEEQLSLDNRSELSSATCSPKACQAKQTSHTSNASACKTVLRPFSQVQTCRVRTCRLHRSQTIGGLISRACNWLGNGMKPEPSLTNARMRLRMSTQAKREPQMHRGSSSGADVISAPSRSPQACPH